MYCNVNVFSSLERSDVKKTQHITTTPCCRYTLYKHKVTKMPKSDDNILRKC